ncbi:MAG: exodeoxyribonuclease VII small subunit [Alicyclobacillus sp.]|nr:exodeoxyribonuclease VII small subunit [Alicyclobacillus sp.]
MAQDQPDQVGQTEENNSRLTFEAAMQRLEECVRRLESGELPLSESIDVYKQAMQLVQFCRQQLDKAELEIEQLLGEETGQGTATADAERMAPSETDAGGRAGLQKHPGTGRAPGEV